MWLFAPTLERDLLDYVGGVMDALDGSHGQGFTYLPIVYQDDGQVVLGDYHHVRSGETRYEVELRFMETEVRAKGFSSNALQGPGSGGR
jgi:hypothetical protein